MIPLVGFLPADDERVRGTLAAIEKDLLVDGYVQRYTQTPENTADGLPPGEGAFLACTFWLADNYSLMGRHDEATAVFERLLALRNDLGLLSEEYDPRAGRLVGNFPQAFSHVPLINTARNLSAGGRSVAPAGENHRGRSRIRGTTLKDLDPDGRRATTAAAVAARESWETTQATRHNWSWPDGCARIVRRLIRGDHRPRAVRREPGLDLDRSAGSRGRRRGPRGNPGGRSRERAPSVWRGRTSADHASPGVSGAPAGTATGQLSHRNGGAR